MRWVLPGPQLPAQTASSPVSAASAAAAVFGRRGYGLASIAEIAAESGMTKGALYFHFPSKDDLARAVIEEQHRRTMVDAAEILHRERPALETMVLLCTSLAHQLLSD